ncbi:MAG: hypothetical protein WCT23_03345 [Candidatus Neomarinimicrobiota bacterium]
MKKSLKITVILFVTLSLMLANKTINIAGFPYMKVSYSGEAEVYNIPCEKLSQQDPFYRAPDYYSSCIKVLECVLNKNDADTISILFSIGEAGVSWYDFYAKGDYNTPIFKLYGDNLDILGEGMIVVTGSLNEMFKRSRAYKVQSGKIKEIEQPYYLVNVKSIAKKDFNIYQNKRLKKVIDQVSKDEKVNVLVADFKKNYNYYLLGTERGLSGWIKIDKETWVDETPIRDIYYHGD